MTIKCLIMLLACVLLTAFEGIAQEQQKGTREYHLKKAKTYRTVGIATGATCLLTIGAAAVVGSGKSEGIGETLDRSFASSGLALTGIAAGAASITFFILSGSQKRKASKAVQPTVYTDRMNIPTLTGQRTVATTQVGVRIRL